MRVAGELLVQIGVDESLRPRQGEPLRWVELWWDGGDGGAVQFVGECALWYDAQGRCCFPATTRCHLCRSHPSRALFVRFALERSDEILLAAANGVVVTKKPPSVDSHKLI